MVFGQQRKFGCQKIKRLIRRIGPGLQGSRLRVGCQGGGAHSGQQSMDVKAGAWLASLKTPMQLWLYLGDLSKSLAIELTHLLQFWLMFMLTECPGNDLKPPCLFFPFIGQSLSNPNLFHQYPPRSQTSPPLPNSFSSEDEMELVTLVSHSLWPWVVMQSGLGPSGLVYLFVTLLQRVMQVITSISVLELQESRDWISSLPSSARPAHPKPTALLFPLALMDTCSIQLEFGEKPCLPLVLSIIKKDRKKNPHSWVEILSG